MENPPPNPTPLSESDARMWATFAHLGFLVGLIVPLGSVLTPLIIWLLHKDKSPFVDHHGKEALNFQITMIIAFVIGAILIFIFIGYFVLIAAFIVNLIFSIMGAVAANNGVEYRYPFSLRVIS